MAVVEYNGKVYKTNALDLNGHVSCCGIKHWWDFGNADNYHEIKEDLTTITAYHNAKGVLGEITLAGYQHREWPSLRPDLEKLGWRCVSEFLNSNSGNTVGVWHFHKDFAKAKPDT